MLKLSAVYAIAPEVDFDVVIRGSFENILKYMRKLGYNGIELNIANPFKIDLAYLRKTVELHGMEVSAISTGLSYLSYGYSLSSLNEDNRRRALEFFRKYIDVSIDLGARKVVVGLARGRCSREKRDKAMERLIDSLGELDDYAGKRGSLIVLEPLNRYETNLINKLSEALKIVKTLKNTKILFDTFHIMLEERDVYDALNIAGSYIGHVHFADSNRLAPGMGMLDWERIVFRLIRTGYRGFVSIEARAEPSLEILLETAIKTLRPLLL